MDETDIWRTAKILIDSHGDNASTEAAIRADRALDDGLPVKPRDGEALN